MPAPPCRRRAQALERIVFPTFTLESDIVPHTRDSLDMLESHIPNAPDRRAVRLAMYPEGKP